jgi:hypothetical protein
VWRHIGAGARVYTQTPVRIFIIITTITTAAIVVVVIIIIVVVVLITTAAIQWTLSCAVSVCGQVHQALFEQCSTLRSA